MFVHFLKRLIKLQSGKNSHNQIPTRKRRCPWIFFIRKTNIKWLSYISVNGSEKWLWKFFPIVFFSIFWKIDKQWRTLALIRCTWNILSKSCIYARHHLHFWKVFSDFSESVLQLNVEKQYKIICNRKSCVPQTLLK